MATTTTLAHPTSTILSPFSLTTQNKTIPTWKVTTFHQKRPFFPTNIVSTDGHSVRESSSCVARYSAAAANPFFNNNSSSSSGSNNDRNNKMMISVGSCLVVPPPKLRKPRAVIKFLGGAFIGAVSHVTYNYLVELLAKEGFLVVLVPYNVTFNHEDATKQVYERFNSCLDTLLSSGLPEAKLVPSQLIDLPVFSVGHSNGALLQVLTASYFSDKIPKANAIVSFNNRPATEAVPNFEQLGPLVSQVIPMVEENPVFSLATTLSGDAWKMIGDTAGAIISENDPELFSSVNQFVDQLPSVFNEVRQGTSEFRPTPSENRECFRCSYNVPHTLLVKFSVDAIDETDMLEETLKPRVVGIGGTLEKVQLNGNHLTPCIQDPKWQVGGLYTPVDAIAQGIKTVSLNDTRVLAQTISNWFRRFED